MRQIKTISSREVYRNQWTRVREDVIERANGERGIYGVVDKDPACIIIPLERTAEGEFVTLVEQYRFTVGGRFMELPQGGWETGRRGAGGDGARRAARRDRPDARSA